MKKKTKTYVRFAIRIFFVLYLLLLVYLMFFAEEWGRSMLEGDYQYNLTPFQEIRRYLTYYRQIGIWRVLWNLVGNVVGFIPYGALLPALREKKMGFGKVALLSFELTLFIELAQLILRVGSCDVDDMILNTLGGCIGYGVYRVLSWRIQQLHVHKETKGVKEKI